MTKAHELLLRHNLSLSDMQTTGNYIHRQIGEIGRTNPIKSIISAMICKFFFVEAVWTFGYDQQRNRSGKILELYGTPENVEMAEYVYHYLQNISELLWEEHKEQKQINGNRHRRTFIYGVLNGFYRKLDSQARENLIKSLVWTGDPRLKDFFTGETPSSYAPPPDIPKAVRTPTNPELVRGKTWSSKRACTEKATVS